MEIIEEHGPIQNIQEVPNQPPPLVINPKRIEAIIEEKDEDDREKTKNEELTVDAPPSSHPPDHVDADKAKDFSLPLDD